jgi:hemolysin activation/secretion protein
MKGKQMKKAAIAFLLAFLFVISFEARIFAQVAVTGQVQKSERDLEKEKALREKVEKKKAEPQVKEELPPPAAGIVSEEKVFVKEIRVTGAKLISQDGINKIIVPFLNKEQSLSQVQKVADLITDAYRKRGFITSRAFLPPQKIAEGIVEINVVEGKMGDIIEVKGNRYFKTKFLKSKIPLKKGDPFDYNLLRKGLSEINQQPDRFAKATLMPGKEPQTTDMALEVKDRLPIHVAFEWDNFGSRYIEKNRYTVRLIDNNLFGFDDRLVLNFPMAEASHYFQTSGIYTTHLAHWELGGYATHSRVKLGEDYEDLSVRGKSRIYGVFASHPLITKDNFTLGFNIGFDYKDITNYQNEAVTSHDRIRVAKTGLDIDATDNFGRTIISNELDFGIPEIMGGLSDKDPRSSRAGAGGDFIKDIINVMRLHRMPFSSNLLWKNQFQYTPDILASAEQFQIGGVSNVRGYPPAEVVGDRGFSTTFEWSFPPYLVSRNFKVPFSKAKFYDAYKTVIFYDWATTRLKKPTGTEEKNRTLHSVGCGLRFNLPEDFSLRLDLAWPLDNTPSDEDHMHPWMQVSKTF